MPETAQRHSVVPQIPLKRHPRAEWTSDQREAWEIGMRDAAVLALRMDHPEVSNAIQAKVTVGPVAAQ